MILDNTTQHAIGNEATKIVCTEGALADPVAVIDQASRQKFAHINPHYPGIRAEVDGALLDQLCQAVSTLAAQQLDYPSTPWIGQAWYSIVTHAPSQLTPIQRLPHFDGFDESQMAVMIYLHQTQHGGTAFYRHRSTGYERVTQARYPDYKTKLEADVRSHGLPPQHYIDDGAPLFERIAQFGGGFNEMILYPGTALHSGVIEDQAPLSPDPRQGRLTINGFFRPG